MRHLATRFEVSIASLFEPAGQPSQSVEQTIFYNATAMQDES
jgi:hypothetical protein